MKRSALKKLNSYKAPSFSSSAYSAAESSSSNQIKIGEASQLIGVSIDTLRRWEKRGWLRVTKTPGGTRLYDKAQLLKLNPNVKRGPKVSPLFPVLPKEEIYTAPATSLFSQNETSSQVHLNSDFPILKTSKSIQRDQIESDIDSSFSQSASQESSHPLFSFSAGTINSLKKNIQLCIVVLLLALPLLLTTNYVKNNQTVSSIFNDEKNPISNNSLVASKDLFKKLSGIFSPTLSHALYGKYSAGSPPGFYADLNNKNSDQLASGRVSGDIKGSNLVPAQAGIHTNRGQVLADSTPSGSFLQINLDAQINGSLSVDTASVSGALYSSTINTGFGDNEVYPMNQPLLTTSAPTFAGLNLSTLTLSATSNQLTLGNTIVSTQTGGSGAFTVSIPTLTANGNFVIDTASQTLTNKTISGSDNTITNIPTSALSSSSITVNAGTGLSGGGSVSLGGSITISTTGSTGAVSSITGTSNQVVASASTGDITLSLPQDIATTSSPTFASLLLTGSTSGTLTLDTAAVTTSYTLTLPADDGTSGYVLQTDGSGNTSWVAQSGGAVTLQSAYDGGNTITTTTGRNIGFTLASGLASSTSLTLTNAGTASAFVLNDTNGATNTSIEIQSGGSPTLTITEAGTLSTSGNISTTSSGTITSASTLTASNGFTQTTGALSQTATSGSISATGLTALTYTLSSGTAAITAPTLNLNTSSTGNTSIGNATGTFALTSNGGLNVTTGGALTGVASIDTISTSATAITFAAGGTLGATSTGLNLQADGSIDVNIAGGSGATGCTVANSTGNLTCTGTITGAGAVGYWTKASTTLSPATANDIVSIANTTTSGADLAITNTGAYTGTGIFNLTANSATTGTVQALSATGLTIGKVQSITATNTATSDTAVTQALYSLTNAQGSVANSSFTGLGLNFTNNPTVAGNTEYAFQIQNQATTNITDNAVTALLRLDNADTSATGSTIVTNGLLITNSGGLTGGFTNGLTIGSGTDSITTGLNLASTGITTDISLQNAETIDNDTDGTINFGVGGTSALKIGSTGISSIGNIAHTIVNSSGALAIDSNSTGAINIGTGATAKTITIGNATGATAVALTSGTGAQTFTSSVTTGATTASAFVFNASSLSSGTALRVTSTSTSGKLVDLNATNTSGTIFNLAYGTSATLTGDTTGLLVDLNSGTVVATNQNLTGVNFKIPTVTNTVTTGTKTLTGMLVNFGSGAGINQNGAGGTLEYIAGDFQMPALTQTAGTLNAYGTKVTTPATITTGGTAYGHYVNATGVGAGTLSGIGISNITGGSGTEYALNVAGTGWDAVLRVGSTTVINGSGITQVPGGGTGLSTVTQNGVVYGNAASNLGVTAEGTTGQVLIATTGSAPSWGSISGSTCTNCLVTDPAADQTIAPTGQGTTGLSVRQTSTASPTDDIFQITNSAGTTKYFYVDKDGNVSTAGTSSQTLTLTPLTDTTALTLVGTNVSSQALQYINSKNASATSGIVNMAYGAAQTLTGTVIGFRQDLSTNVTATNQSVTGTQITLPAATNTSGTQTYKGLVISGGALNENGGTATTFTGADITIPALTQTSGTLTAYGANITTPSSITTAGTAYGVNIAASGVGAGTLYGVNISDITPGAGTEVGMQIGSGWDTNLLLNDTTSRVALANGGTLTILDTAGNSLCTITDSGSTGDLSCTGNISGSGSVGYWSRSGTTLSPVTSGDAVTTSGNISTSSTGTITSAGTLTASNGLTQTTGALNLTATSGSAALTLSSSTTAFNINSGVLDVDTTNSRVGVGTTSPSTTLHAMANDSSVSSNTNVLTVAHNLSASTTGDSSVKLFMHMDGSNGSTTFTDNSSTAHTVTANGGAQLNTTTKKFGTAAGAFDGTGDYLSAPDSSDWDFGSNAFTIETQIYLSSVPGAGGAVIYSQDSGTAVFTPLAVMLTSSRRVSVYASTTGSSWNLFEGTEFCDASLVLTTGAWHHFAFVRSGSSWYVFIDGTQCGTTQTAAGTLFNATNNLYIGGQFQSTSGSGGINGYLDEYRVSNGVARWISNFTAPTAAYSTTAGQNNIASSILFQNQNANATQISTGQISSIMTTATDLNEVGALTFSTVNNSGTVVAPTERMRIAGNGNVGINNTTPSYKLDLATSTASDRGINIANTASTGTNYGIYSSVTGAATANIGGYFVATGATTNRGLEVAAMTGATSTGLTIGALSGTTADTGISIGAISGSGATGTGITIGNISTTGTANRGIDLGTMTGGSSTNYQINTGALTAVASATNAQLNIGGITGTAASSTNYGINIGTLDSTGTSNTGLRIGAVSGATSNYEIAFVGTSPEVAVADGGTITISDGTNTLCTIADAGTTGNLTCTGNITGSSSGTAGFWSRTSTTLSPATANDIVSIANTTTTGADLALTNTGIYTGTGVFNLTANSATTGNIGSISANGLTTGNALAISSTSTAGGASGASYLLNLSRSGTNSNATHTSYGIASSVTNTGTTSVNVGGLFTANGATTNRGIEVAAMTGATSTGLTIGALSGTTANTGINIGAISGIGASGTGITVGNISTTGTNNYGLLLGTLTGGTSNNQQIATGAITATGSVINAQLNLGGVSGTANNSVNYGVLVGNISTAGTLTTNVGVGLGTLTGGTAANYQINTGILTSATTTTNAQINLGGVVTTGGTTNYGINIGALSGTGTTNTALNITAATSTGTTTGIAVGALSGAGTTNTGISVGAVSGATTNNALTTAGGAVSFTDASNTVASLSLTNNTATTFGNGGNTAGVIDLQSTTLSTGNFMNIEVNGLTTGTGFNLSSSGTIASGGELMSLQATGITTGRILDISSAANTLTSGQLVSIVTSSSALTGSTTTGSLLQTSYTGTNGSTFVGNLNYFNYSPASTPSTSPTGDLMRLHLGANATNFAGNLFNLVDDTTSIFSVSKTAFTTSLPSNFTAAGDVAIAYDLNFTNPTASYIKSAAPLAIVAGETFNSSNLTLQTYNQGTIVLDTANTTTTAVDLTNSNLTTGTGFNVSLNALTTGTGVSINSSSTAATSGTLLSVAQTGATTGITGAVAALSTTASTNSSARLLTLTANSMTVGKILTISGTGITSGQALQIDGSTTVGVTGNFVNIATDVGSAGSLMNLAPDFSGSAVTGAGLKLTATDATANANNDRAIQSTLTLTGNAAKTGYSIYSDISSSSTTADTLYSLYSTGSVSGIITTGTRNVYGIASQHTVGAESTGGTTNVYGIYSQTSADVGAGGTLNAYGVYVDSGTYDTDGTSTAYGLYVAPVSGADNNYSAVFAGGNVGIGTSTPQANLSFATAGSDKIRLYGTTATANYGLGIASGNTQFYLPTSPTTFFSINKGGDLQTAGTNELMRVQSDGNVGIGTTGPVGTLHVNLDSTSTTIMSGGALSNKALLLSNNSTTAVGMFTGIALNTGSGDTGSAIVNEVTDTTGSSTSSLHFYVNGGSGWTDTTPTLTLAGIIGSNAGNVGINTNAPAARLTVLGTSGTTSFRVYDATNTYYTSVYSDGSNNSYFQNSGNYCTISAVAATSWSCPSDRRLKENINPLADSGLDAINRLNPVNFNRIGSDFRQSGFIAQDVMEVIPNAVSLDGYGKYLLNMDQIAPYIVKSIQELDYKVENALLTINPDGTSNTNLNIQKITVSGDAKIGGLVSASNFALDANLLNRSGAMASVPVSGNKVSLADSVNALNNQTTANTNALSQLELEQASQSAELAQARILGEQAVNHAETLDEKVASTSANLSSLSSRIDDLLASLSGESTDSATTNDEPITTNDLTPPTQLIATDSATFAFDPSVTSVTLDTLVASESLKSLGETFLGQTTIAGDLSVDGTLSFTNGNSINAFPTLFFQNNPLAEAVDFFNGKITLDKDGVLAAESLALGDQSLGTATIDAGQTEITIPSEIVASDSRIFLTPESSITGNIYVGQKVTGSGFIVKLSQPNPLPIKFNWMIVQTKEAGI